MLGVQERLVSVARSPLTAGQSLVTPWSNSGHTVVLQSYGQKYSHTVTHSDEFTQSSQKVILQRDSLQIFRIISFPNIFPVCCSQRSEVWSHHAASQSPDDGASIMTIRWRLQTKVDEENNVVYTIYDIFVKL